MSRAIFKIMNLHDIAFTILMLSFPFSLYSQITITQSEFTDIFIPGKVFYVTERVADLVDIGKTHGPNVYDFTSIDVKNLNTISNYQVDDIAGLIGRFPSRATTFGNSPNEIEGNPVFYINDDSVFIAGYATVSDNLEFIHHRPYELFSVFPLTYGQHSFWQETDVFDTTYNNSGQLTDSYSYHDIRTTGVDGYGTLKIPGRELECIRLRRDYSWYQYKEYYYLTKVGVMVVVAAVSSYEPDSGIVTGKKQIILPSSAVKVRNISGLPEQYILYQNYPNPFNPVTNIELQIVRREVVTLKVYDILGKEVSTIINKELEAGFYKYQWNAERLPSGIYFCRLNAGNYNEVKKLIMIK